MFGEIVTKKKLSIFWGKLNTVTKKVSSANRSFPNKTFYFSLRSYNSVVFLKNNRISTSNSGSKWECRISKLNRHLSQTPTYIVVIIITAAATTTVTIEEMLLTVILLPNKPLYLLIIRQINQYKE